MAESSPSGPTAVELEEQLQQLEQRVERVRVLYEQYFMGIERTEPLVARKEIQRAVLTLQQIQIRNTGLRFRFNSMLQKWNIQVTYWNRTLREIEQGTYTRHLQRAIRAAEREGKELPPEVLRARQRLLKGHLARTQAEATRPEHESDGATVSEARGPVATAASASSASATPSGPMTRQTTPPLRPAASSVDLSDEVEAALAALGVPETPPVVPGNRTSVAALFKGREAQPAPAPGAAPRRVEGAPPPMSPPTTATRPPAPAPSLGRAAGPGVAPPGAAQGPRPSAATGTSGPTDADIRSIHQRFNELRRTSGEAGAVSYEAMASSLSKQAAKLLEQPGVTRVRFDVGLQNGKPVVKAIAEKSPTK